MNGIDVCKKCIISEEFCRRAFRSKLDNFLDCAYFPFLIKAVQLAETPVHLTPEEYLYLKDFELFLDKIDSIY